jgi:hypothetical protein
MMATVRLTFFYVIGHMGGLEAHAITRFKEQTEFEHLVIGVWLDCAP